MVPFAGWGATGAKAALKYGDTAVSLAKHSDTFTSLTRNASKAAEIKPFQVGQFDELQRLSKVGDDLALHHAGQKHAMKQIVPRYNPANAPSIALPTVQHQAIPNVTGPYTGTARELLARDIRNLRNYTHAPNSSLQELIELNKSMYPGSFTKP